MTTRILIRLLYVAAAALVLFCFLCSYDSLTGFTSVIRFGERFSGNRLAEVNALPVHTYADSFGYDGQFYAQMALHPGVDDDAIRGAMDNPGYRFRRILPSWLAAVAGLNDPWITLNAYALLNLVFWLLTALLLLHWLPPVSIGNFARWTACLYGVGTISSLQLALLDLPAAFFVLLAVFLVEKGRDKWGAISLAAAILTRESSVISLTMRLQFKTLRSWLSELPGLAAFSLIAILPFALWTVYLFLHVSPFSSGSASNFALPLSGYAGELREAFEYLMRGRLFNTYAVTGLTVQIATLVLLRDFRSTLWRTAISYVVLALFLGQAVWEADPGAAYRVLLLVPIAFNILLKDGRWFWPLFATGNLGVIISLHYILRWL